MGYSKPINKLLYELYKNGCIDKSNFSHSDLKVLFQDKIIENSSDYHDNNVYLTDKGKAYVEELKKTRFLRIHDWVNTGIAAMSLIVAIIALIV